MSYFLRIVDFILIVIELIILIKICRLDTLKGYIIGFIVMCGFLFISMLITEGINMVLKEKISQKDKDKENKEV
jgi:hypothetical protein